MVDELRDLVSSGALPDDPRVLQAIKDGKVSSEVAQKRYAEVSKKASVFQRTTKVPEQEVINNQQDSILNNAIKNDEIPNDPNVLGAIKSGKLNIELAKQRYGQIKSKNPGMVFDEQGNLNNEQDVVEVSKEVVKKDAKDIAKSFVEDLKAGKEEAIAKAIGGDVSAQSLKEDVTRLGESAVSAAKTLPSLPEAGMRIAGGPIAEAATRGVDETVDAYLYRAKKLAQGLSFGIYQPDPEVHKNLDTADKIVGFGAELAGYYVTGRLAGSAMRRAPGTKQAIEGIEKVSTTAKEKIAAAEAVGKKATGAKVAKHAANIAGISIEAAPLGFAAGAGRAAVEGEKFPDIMAAGVIDAALFTGFGAALYGAMGAAGKAFGKTKTLRGEQLNTRAQLDEVAAGLSKGDKIDGYIKMVEKIPEAERTPIQARTLDALKKIHATQPVAGPVPEVELIRDVEVLDELLGKDASEMVGAIFKNEGAPLKTLYDSEPTIKSLIDNGKNVDALAVAQTFFREQAKDYKTVGELLSAPFMNDVSKVTEVIADRVAGKIDPTKYPKLNRNLIVNYIDDAMAGKHEALDASSKQLREIVTDKKVFRKTFGSKQFKTKEGLMDIRLKAEESDKLVGSILDDYMKVLSNDPKIDSGVLRKLKDTDSLLKAAIYHNKTVNRNMAEAYTSGGMFRPDFMTAPNELQGALRSEINVRRVAFEMGDEIDLVKELSTRRKEVLDAGKAELAEDLAKQIKAAKNRIYRQSKTISKEKATIASLTKEQQAEVRQLADDAFIPTKKELGISQTSEYLNRIGYRDNPYYIRLDSELADMINMMNVKGIDVDKRFEKVIGGPAVVNFENLSRWANRQFGYNSPVEKFTSMVKDREVAAIDYRHKIMNGLSELGIKKGSTASDKLMQFAEKKISVTSPEFQALPAKMQRQIVEAEPILRKGYDKMLDDINAVMARNNLGQIAKRKDYVTHLMEINETIPDMHKIIDILETQGQEAAQAALKEYNFISKKGLTLSFVGRKGDPTKSFMSWELPRTGAEYVSDAIGAIETYSKAAADRIFYTDLVRKADTMRSFSTGNMAELFDFIKRKKLLKLPPEIDKLTSPGFKKAAGFMQRRFAEGLLYFNINTVLQQITSIPLSLMAGGKASLTATMKAGTNESRTLVNMSRNLKLRKPLGWNDMDAKLFSGASKWAKKINASEGAQRVKAGYEYWKKIGLWGLETFDKVAAEHAYLTGIEAGRKAGIKNTRDLVKYADKWADMLQVDFSQMSRINALDSVIGRSMLQFQSFTLNLGATLMNDLPNMAFHEGAGRVVKGLLRVGAAASLTNSIAEEAGMPKPYSLETFIPMYGSFRYGVPGLIGAGKELAGAVDAGYGFVTGTKSNRQASAQGLKALKFAGKLSVAGGGQAMKTFEGLTNRKVRNKGTAAIFGPSAERRKTTEDRAGRKSFLSRKRKKLEKGISSKIKKLF